MVSPQTFIMKGQACSLDFLNLSELDVTTVSMLIQNNYLLSWKSPLEQIQE